MARIISVLVLFVAFALGARSQQPKTVTDFYFLLPEEYFAKPDIDKFHTMSVRDYRESAIKIKDISHGYLRVEEPVRDGWAEVAIFKERDGKYIVGISEVDCAPGCHGKITFLMYGSEGPLRWYDMTNTVLPDVSKSQIRAAYKRHRISDDSDEVVYMLPRFGTSVKVQNAGDYFDLAFKPTELFELDWIGWRFLLRNK